MIRADFPGARGRVRHAFFDRRGGVSNGVYASLNCGLGSGDDPALVRANRARALAHLELPPHALATCYQVHSAEVRVAEAPWRARARPRADGLVTRTRGLALGIVTADCAPVLLADAVAGVVGAAHAGWRGARAGVLDATVTAMCGLGARRARITAAVGPCIAQASYEVGPEFHAHFTAADAADADLFVESPRSGHHMFDLPGYVRRRLERLALGDVQVADRDTCAEKDAFFSYRRTTLDGGGDYGRMLAAIALAP